MNTFKDIISEVEKLDPLHSKKIKKDLSDFDEDFFRQADLFVNRFDKYLQKHGKSLDYGIQCYLKMIADVRIETMHFMRTGEYTSKSFDEVNQRVYSNPEVMEYYMNGLLLSQFLWSHHYAILQYFTKKMRGYKGKVTNYLEMGGGHGLYISEAVNILEDETKFDLIDISPTSIEASKAFIESNKVNYILSDIFKVSTDKLYDFITMGEVLEHVEDPVALLVKLGSLLVDGGTMFITTPTNAPAIDHIYLFKTADDVRQAIDKAGFKIVEDEEFYTEKVSKERVEKFKIATLYAAFIQKK